MFGETKVNMAHLKDEQELLQDVISALQTKLKVEKRNNLNKCFYFSQESK
jgi:hypothetical protein